MNILGVKNPYGLIQKAGRNLKKKKYRKLTNKKKKTRFGRKITNTKKRSFSKKK
jgi:hypothetical protein